MENTVSVQPRAQTVLFILLAAVGGGLLSFLAFGHQRWSPPPPAPAEQTAPATCDLDLRRMYGNTLTKPLLFAERSCPSPALNPMMGAIGHYVDSLTAAGVLTSASVFVRQYRLGEWAVYNDTAHFDPGSMMKVPVLMTYMKMLDDEPTLLQRSYMVMQDVPSSVSPRFPPKEEVVINHSYTVDELLQRMVRFSDNRATMLLMNHMDMSRFLKVFTDLGLAMPEVKESRHPMTAREFSCFFKTLYNGSYLGIDNSEKALRLLTTSDFDEGILRGIPKGTPVAHKFGETGGVVDPISQLHESALVFEPGNNYLLTVMTKGPDINKLPDVVATISKIVHERMPK